MDSPGVTPGSALSSNDENPRVKFLCSFSGNIFPRPQDGKLRYVGGETRIVSVPRDITYEDLMGKMRELFEGAIVLKYQQPDEDLDALVSVVNDDDVVNMMEEYDKLDSGDGFTRLRLFLFSNTDQDGSMHFGDGDEWDNERRYVDALNSLNESPDFRNQSVESPVMGSLDDSGYFSQLNLEGSFHGQRNMELPMAQMNLRQLTIPRSSSQQQVTQRYSEMEAPWSPAYYSPRQPVAEFPTSPSTRYRTPYPDYSDRVPEPHYPDNVVLIPNGPNEKAGFPGNIIQGSGVYEGNNVCGNCRMTFNRNQVYPDYAWRPSEQQHLEPPNLVNGYLQVPNSCNECPQNREMYMLNSDPNMHPSFYPNDPRAMYPDTHTQERDFISPHHPNQESRSHIPVPGRLPDNYIIENGTSTPLGHANVCDGARIHCPYIHHEGQRYNRPGFDYGSQVFQDPAVPQIHLPSIHGNAAYTYGADNLYQMQPGHIPPQTLWRNVHTPLPGGPVPSYGTTVPPQLVNGSVGRGFTSRGRVLENQSPWAEPSQKCMGNDGSLVSQAVNLIPNTHTLENHRPHIIDPIQPAGDFLELETSKDPPLSFLDDKVNTVGDSGNENDVTELVSMKEKGIGEGSKEINNGETEDSGTWGVICGNADALAPYLSVNGDVSEPDAIANDSIVKVIETTPEQVPDDRLDVLPELIASAKEAALQSVKEVKDKVQGVSDLSQEDAHNEIHGADGNVDFEVGSDNKNVSKSKIEQTKAEEEAIDHGLQTIKNEDLEEIRELGSGTYGSVFHGKWRGSDVAIKRIKASCFAGRPSERERLIADFWKEAQILSSLHHPNVVAFYGVVRDGPDGSLATVTEFMINGSLKQFLQKKDRTIDRRKRLMIAMDTAFGMEYLHGKNIVHFDLKCENLLVNMRDPHRPICKIGDLGLSKVKRHTLVSGGVRGTLPWMAPELLSGKSNMVTEKIDVYSFGIVMWELLTGDEPYADMHCASIIGGIVNNTLRPQIPTWCDPEWKALMESSWASEPSQRPSFSEISQKLRTMAAAMNLK